LCIQNQIKGVVSLSSLSTGFFWACLFATHAWATDYYVSSSGNDSKSGSSSAPWKTIAKVNKQTYKPGDRILLQGGATFVGNITFNSSSKGTAGAPITVTSWGTGRALIFAGNGVGLSGYNTAGFLIQNINFQGAGVASNSNNGVSFYADLGGGVKLDTIDIDQVDVSGFHIFGVSIGGGNGATGFQNIRITNVYSHDNGIAGIDTWGPRDPNNVWYPHQNIYVGHCQAYDNQGMAETGGSGSGIAISSVNGALIERSVAYNNGVNNVSSTGSFGIWTYDSTNVTIQYNESHHNHTSGSADGGGFDLDGGVSHSILQYNYSHDNDGPGVLLTQFPGSRPQTANVVRYNISQNDARRNALGSITVYAAGASLSGEEIFNNLIYLTGASANPWSVIISGSVSQLHFRNNIFFTASGALTIYVAPNLSGILFQGNDYWNGGAALCVYWGSTGWSNLNSWRTATGQETLNGSPTGFSVNPQFNDAGGGGTLNNSDHLNLLSAYQLLSGSPLMYKGLNLNNFGVAPGSNDFYGTVIPQSSGYSVGATEF
jgi:hypothetical protein